MKKKLPGKILTVIKYLAIYYLSLKMISFAIPKLLHMQFRVLHYESFLPLAEISKHQHMWSFFGRSYNYNLFIGLMEFLIGALIVFKRTRLIALLISLGVCLNILILNIEFDIDFAIQHISLDLILTILLLVGYHKDLYTFFIKFGGKFKNEINPSGKSWATKLPILYLLIFPIGYFIYAYNMRSGVNDKLVGSYEIKNTLVGESGLEFSKGKLGSAPMLFFEYNNQAVLSINDSIHFGSYAYDKEGFRMFFRNSEHNPLQIIRGDFKDNTIIEGKLNDSISIKMEIEKLPEEQDYLNHLYTN